MPQSGPVNRPIQTPQLRTPIQSITEFWLRTATLANPSVPAHCSVCQEIFDIIFILFKESRRVTKLGDDQTKPKLSLQCWALKLFLVQIYSIIKIHIYSQLEAFQPCSLFTTSDKDLQGLAGFE